MDFTGIESHYSGTYSALCIKLPTQIDISEQEHVKKFAFLRDASAKGVWYNYRYNYRFPIRYEIYFFFQKKTCMF